MAFLAINTFSLRLITASVKFDRHPYSTKISGLLFNVYILLFGAFFRFHTSLLLAARSPLKIRAHVIGERRRVVENNWQEDERMKNADDENEKNCLKEDENHIRVDKRENENAEDCRH